MRRVSILSIALLGSFVALGTSCSSGTNTPTGVTDTGGSDTGGSATGGGSGQGGSGQSGGTGNQSGGTGNQSGGNPSGGNPSGGNPSGGTPGESGGTSNPSTGGTTGDTGGTSNPSTGGTGNGTGGGGTQIGTTNPANAVQLPGDYLSNGTLKGYCYTYGDYSGSGTSTVSPPCGDTGPCFSASTGMCIAGATGISSSTDNYASWGVGVGCNVNEDQSVDGGSTTANPMSVASMTTITITVYGDTMPTGGFQVSVQSSGTGYCAIVSASSVTAGTPFTVPLSSLKTECWGTTGTAFDPATMQITALQLQVQSTSSAMQYDMCVSQFSIS